VLSVLALLVPAGGIAYLGAVSYDDEHGAVQAQRERNRQAAKGIVARIERAIEDALDTADRAAVSGATSEAGAGLARYWFWIEADGHIRVPRAAPVVPEAERAIDRPVSGKAADYLQELSRRLDRATKLRAAQRAEAGAANADARRQYTALVGFDDTGAEALLGLARVNLRLGDTARAIASLDELDRRFGDRSFERVPVKLVTALMRAEAAGERRATALLDIADAVLANRYVVDPIVGMGIVTRIRGEVGSDAGAKPRLAALDVAIKHVREQARAAAGLAEDKDELVRSATPAWRGRPAARQPGRTLIYRRRADGSIIGIAVDAGMLAGAAGTDPADDVAVHARPIVLASGDKPDPKLVRTIEQVAFDERLPHLSLALVNPSGDPDPLDEVVDQRSRRHVVLTSGLAILLGVGLLAMIRGAARARELAQLKSDFVSTVSHELKTPLTSIRMFAEMLEQGVAQGDAAKMQRYHGVIVQESQRLGLLIANLLDYAQIERGTRRYTPTTENLAQLGKHAVTTFETLRDPERGGRNPIEVKVSDLAMETEVEVDREVVVQAVLNLISNAAKYGGADKPIEVAIDADADAATIAVRDHGPGIPSHEQARIFREFYRTAEAYRSNIEGTGLGLALVKQHVEALGGSVEVRSVVGEGATFTIKLPRIVEATA
jgi:two-component system, OmpR family, phosphate regulon sensor histidine kinase PhoR